MSINLPTRHAGFVPRKIWAGAAILSLGFLFGNSGAIAAVPPASTVIGNQASATYLDPNNNSQLATSNLVQTTVQQVGSFTLDSYGTTTTNVVNTKSGAAGMTVTASHVLTNTGNGVDGFNISVAAPASPAGFTKVEVYADADGDGRADTTTPLCTVTPTANCVVPVQNVAGSNGVFQFIVAYTIPSTATTTSFTSPAAPTITAVPSTTSLYAAGNQTAAVKDNVNLATGAAFNASTSLAVPAVQWSANGGVWPVASANGQRSAASCAATIAGASAPAAGCVYTTYTLNFNNSGATAGMFAIRDTLPAGFTYVPGSAIWSSASGTALTDAAGGDTTGIDFQASGQAVTAVVASLAPNVSQTVSFVVMVNSTAAIGTTTTANTAMYSPLDAAGSTSTTPVGASSPTNASMFTVTGTFGVVVGSSTGTTTTAVDSPAGTPNTTAGDTTSMASAVVGTMVKFTQTAFNTGNTTDTINLTAAVGSFPGGTTFAFFAADGRTPLIDSNGDGIVDTGPLAAGASVTFVVAANLPAMSTIPAGPFSAFVRGTSAGDTTKFDATRDAIGTLIGVLVDLTNTSTGNGTVGTSGNGDVGVGPSPIATVTQSTPAGTGTLFTLFVKNNDSVINTYSLAASQTSTFPGSLPTGWTVKFVALAGTCASTAITQVQVDANAQIQVLACVTPPASQVATSGQQIFFRVLSTTATSNGAIASDTITDSVAVTIANTYSATLTPNNNGQLSAGGAVVYAHTLTNTGAQSCAGPYTVTAALPAADVTAGWTTALYIDNNGDGQLDSGDTLITGSIAGPLTAGSTQKLLVKVFSPGGATGGATDTATVTVTFPTGATSCGTPSATDVSTVVTAQIRLVKLQANDPTCAGSVVPTSATVLVAKPGECIAYKVTATNQGTAPVSSMSLNDAIPSYTSLTGATQPSVHCSSVNTTPVFSNANYTASTSTVGCATATTVQPGGTATLSFNVKVNQ